MNENGTVYRDSLRTSDATVIVSYTEPPNDARGNRYDPTTAGHSSEGVWRASKIASFALHHRPAKLHLRVSAPLLAYEWLLLLLLLRLGWCAAPRSPALVAQRCLAIHR